LKYSDDAIDSHDRHKSKELAGLSGDCFPYETGVLPDDFPQRLTRLKEASGLTWSGLSRTLGVDPKQMYRWRKGTGALWGSHALPVPFRKPDARRHADPHGRRSQNELPIGGDRLTKLS